MTSTTASAASASTPLPALPKAFPFVALLGQDLLQQALLLVAVDAGLGGVLIAGPRGTAKSTSARALAALLAPAPFVTLPLGASEAQLIGSLDLDVALREGAARFAPGLLAKAHGGVLYVDEVNLLPDALADALLDAAASGINVVERDGVSHRHAARFMLIGTMNEEEGELRPQLSDRFGLSVVLENYRDVAMREAIVRARLAFDLDPEAFVASHAANTQALRQRIDTARGKLSALSFSDVVHRRVSEWCLAAAVDGVRADLVMLKAARAQAALDGAETLTVAHVDRVAPLVLSHRRQSGARPLSSAGTDAPGQDGQTAFANGMPDASPSKAEGAEADHARGASQDGRPQNGSGSQAPHPPGASAANNAPNRGDGSRERDGRQPAGLPGENGAVKPSAPDGDPAADWGYLAPEPTATAAVKQVRPYDAKKA